MRMEIIDTTIELGFPMLESFEKDKDKKGIKTRWYLDKGVEMHGT